MGSDLHGVSGGLANPDGYAPDAAAEGPQAVATSSAKLLPPHAGVASPALDAAAKRLRVTVVQPSLAKYRVPVFQELARRPGIELRVAYGAVQRLPNVNPDGFEAIPVKAWEGRVGGALLTVQPSEWTSCSRRRADVVVLRWSPRSATLFPALLRARAAGLPVVVWGHGYSKDPRGKRYGTRVWLAKWASAIVFYEPLTREAYIRDGWNPEKLFVALNSLDHSEIESARGWWQERPDNLAHFRCDQGLDAGPVILFLSRLLPENRADLLIMATAQLAREIPGLKTVIIGSGEPEKERLNALAAREGIARNIIFQDGIYDEIKLAPWFLSADLVCYPANMGLSLIHAFWYGLPVVTNGNLDVQGPEVVALEHGVNGLSYDYGNLTSLVDAMRQIVTNESMRESMSQAARRTVEDRFTIPRMVDGLEAAIRYAGKSR